MALYQISKQIYDYFRSVVIGSDVLAHIFGLREIFIYYPKEDPMEAKRLVSTKVYKRFSDPSDIDSDLIQDLLSGSEIVANLLLI